MNPRQVVAKYLKQKAAQTIKSGKAAVAGVGKVVSRGKAKTKDILKDKQRVTVVENQPVYSKDKSRYFKTAWEEENRQLYFK